MSIAQSANPLAAIASGHYHLDPGLTKIQIVAKANWGLQTVRATFRLQDGSFALDDDGSLVNVAAVIDAASFHSRNSKRDRHIASSDFLDVQRYPTITFAAQRSRGDDRGIVLAGHVTIHGITEPVDVRVVHAVSADGGARVHAETELDRTTFGITHMPRRVGTKIGLAFDAFAVPA